MPLGLVTCLFLVAAQHPLLGLYVIYHCQGELSSCLFSPVDIRFLETETLFLLRGPHEKVHDRAPWRWWGVCWVNERY